MSGTENNNGRITQALLLVIAALLGGGTVQGIHVASPRKPDMTKYVTREEFKQMTQVIVNRLDRFEERVISQIDRSHQ